MLISYLCTYKPHNYVNENKGFPKLKTGEEEWCFAIPRGGVVCEASENPYCFLGV